MYLHQFRHATHAILLSHKDYLARTPRERPLVQPIFLLSIGRCGSTLLSKAAHALHVTSISEADILSNLSSRRRAGTLAEAQWNDLYQASIAQLSGLGNGGPTTLFKYRAQSSTPFHAKRLLRLYPKAKYLLLFRELRPWSLSCANTFDFDKHTLGWLLTSAIETLDLLSNKGADLTTVWYEQFSTNDGSISELILGRPARSGDATRMSGVFAQHSQQGTRIADKKKRASVNVRAAEFMEYWDGIRPASLIAKHGLPY
jgi:hypothetical protein